MASWDDLIGKGKMPHPEKLTTGWLESWEISLAGNLPFKIFLKGCDLTYLACNETNAADHGLKPGEILGRSDYDLYPKELAERYRAEDLRILETGQSETIEESYVKDGQGFHGQTIKSLFRDQSGEVIGILGVFWDVSKLKRTEEALQESEAKYRSPVENANEAIIVNQDGVLKFTNPKISKLLGYSPEEAVGRSFLEFVHPDDQLLVVDRCRKRLEGEVPTVVCTFRAIHKDGSIRWAEIHSVLTAWEGKPAIMSYLTDITERKRVEEKLQESQEKFRQLFTRMPSAVAIYDAVDDGEDFVFKDFNIAAEKIEGIKKDDLVGQRVTHVFPGVKEFGIFSVFQRVWRTGQPEFFPSALYYDERDPGTWRKSWVFKLASGEVVAIYDDITERKRAEEALQENESFSRGLVENLPDYIAIYGPDGNIVYVNPASAAVLGYRAEELVGTPVLKHVAEEYRHEVVSRMTKRQELSEVPSYEIELLAHDGLRRSVIVKGAQIQYREHPATLLVLTDITERKRAEEALKESERRLTEAQRIGKIGNWEWIPSENKLIWSAEMYDIFGIAPETILNTEASIQAFHPEDRAIVEEATRKTLEASQPQPIECRILKSDGTIGYVFGRGEILLDANGKLVKMVGIYQDITERKRAEEALRESEEKHRNVVERANDGIAILQDGIIKFSNPSLATMLGFATREVAGMEISRFIPQEYLQRVMERYQKRMAGEELLSVFETALVQKNGRKIPVEVSGGLIQYEGKPADLVVIHDITDRKRLEGEMDKTRADFLFGVSHELKTPLFLMNISLEMLENSPEFGRVKRISEFMDIWKQNLHRLEHLICNMVDSQRTQTMGFNLERQSTNFPALIKRVVQELELLAKPKKVRINMDLGPIPPLLIDPEAIHRLVENLLTNAIKFSPRGCEVTIRLAEEDAQAVFTVKDQGPGISAEEQKGLFLPFQRAATTVQSVIPGTGLGLYVSKIIVDAHGGKISLRSKVGKGTTITVRLPLE